MNSERSSSQPSGKDEHYTLFARAVVLLAFVLVTIGVGLAWHGRAEIFGVTDLTPASAEKIAAYSGYFGGIVNGLWALAGFLLIFASFLSQQRQLDIQRQEVLQNAVDARVDRFESRFFQLLEFHHAIVDTIHLDIKGKERPSGFTEVTYSGRNAFDFLIARFNDLLEDAQKESRHAPVRAIQVAYHMLYEEYGNEIGHYFRNLYHVFKYIEDNKRQIDNPKSYSSLVRAQMSTNELGLLFYNIIASIVYTDGPSKFRPFARDYALFENMKTEVLLFPYYYNLFEREAFGDSYDRFRKASQSWIESDIQRIRDNHDLGVMTDADIIAELGYNSADPSKWR